MFADKRFLAVVPARGGSKSIPRKNIRPLAGRPLLHYTLDQAAGVPEIDRTLVSTDDPEVTAIARARGGEVLDRPAALATDSAPTEWALLHALDRMEEAGCRFDYVIVLEPTSPFRSPETIRRCMARIVQTGAPSLMTVVETRDNIGRLENGRFRPLVPGAPRRRQAREPYFIESSTVYIARVDFLRRTGSLVSDDWVAEPIPEAEALDINTPLDLAVAEALMQASKSQDGRP